MEEKTLKELWDSLDTKGQVKLLGLISENLFTTTSTANAYVRGYRTVPEMKRTRLGEIVSRNNSVKLKFSQP